ncbi:antA/AntB antirepressor family protein [Bartonella sp. DGB2]|uniref:antA/AntB antirepressor family protein n=1 Tax=Bartonella sp. DGB2 TaxID=3388426 RepID=UPI00398FD067
MQQLIHIQSKTFNNTAVQTVNARELHAFLKIGKDFSTWIKARIQQYGFEENEDYFLTFPKIGERQNVVLKEYHLTLDVAKELSMVEKNERGKQARQYFIECERRLKALQPNYDQIDYSSPRVLLGVFTHLRDENQQLKLENIHKQEIIETLEPKAEALDKLANSNGLFTLYEAAKNLKVRPKFLTSYLEHTKWAYRHKKGAPLIPYQDKIQSGFLETKVTSLWIYGSNKTVTSVRITAKGLAKLATELSTVH